MKEIELPSFLLIPLYHPTKEMLEYLKKLNQDPEITQYFPDLSIYIGRENAFFIKENDQFIGFLALASTREENVKELFFAKDQEHRGNKSMKHIIKEVLLYLFLEKKYQKIIITPMNPYSKQIAIENNFLTIDGFHYYYENPSNQNKL